MKARRGVLMRTIPVRLLNVSSSGFLLETHESVDAGTTGILDVDTGNTRYLSPANLLRSVHRPGAGQTHQLGGVFAPSLAAAERPTQLRPTQHADAPSRQRPAARAPHTSAA